MEETLLTSNIDAAVGIPQFEKSLPISSFKYFPSFLALIDSIIAKEVPPAPPTSIASIPSSAISITVSLDIPHPVSLTIIGVPIFSFISLFLKYHQKEKSKSHLSDSILYYRQRILSLNYTSLLLMRKEKILDKRTILDILIFVIFSTDFNP